MTRLSLRSRGAASSDREPEDPAGSDEIRIVEPLAVLELPPAVEIEDLAPAMPVAQLLLCDVPQRVAGVDPVCTCRPRTRDRELPSGSNQVWVHQMFPAVHDMVSVGSEDGAVSLPRSEETLGDVPQRVARANGVLAGDVGVRAGHVSMSYRYRAR